MASTRANQRPLPARPALATFKAVKRTLFLLLLVLAPQLPAQDSVPTASRRVTGSPRQTFTDSQTVRGAQWFESVCLHCHATQDMTSPDFRVRWSGRSALELFLRIRSTMPEDDPGSLSDRTYADVVAYLMKLNGLIAGVQPLTADTTVLAAARLGFPVPASAPK